MLFYIHIHGSGEWGVYQTRLNPIYMPLHVMPLKAVVNGSSSRNPFSMEAGATGQASTSVTARERKMRLSPDVLITRHQ